MTYYIGWLIIAASAVLAIAAITLTLNEKE